MAPKSERESKAVEMLQNPTEERDKIQRYVSQRGIIGGAKKYWTEQTESHNRTLSGLVLSMGSIWLVRHALLYLGLGSRIAFIGGLLFAVLFARRWFK